MRSLILGLILLVAVAAAILAWLWQDMQRELHSPMPLAATTDYTVERGMTLRTIATDLQQRGWITQPYYLLFAARQQNLGGRIKAGEYVIEPGTTPQDFLGIIVSGRVKQYSLTIVEGWNYRELLAAVRAHPKLEQTLASGLEHEPTALAETLELSHPHPEGLFYPDTYNFPAGTTDVQFLQRAHRTLLDVLDQEWIGREDDLPYKSAYEALIMASIIEKETAVAAERGEIAGVFYRRLKIGMRLQTDPTVIYAIGDQYDGRLRRADLQFESPYNTYVSDGLPPTPIAMAGRASIHATLHPQPGETLYFVSRGDGTHYFSRDLQEHNRAVAKYQLGRKGIELPNE